jgi:hypothetical protein
MPVVAPSRADGGLLSWRFHRLGWRSELVVVL